MKNLLQIINYVAYFERTFVLEKKAWKIKSNKLINGIILNYTMLIFSYNNVCNTTSLELKEENRNKRKKQNRQEESGVGGEEPESETQVLNKRLGR